MKSIFVKSFVIAMLLVLLPVTANAVQVRAADAGRCQAMLAKYRAQTCHCRDIAPVEKCFEKIIKKDPDDVQGRIGLAQVRFRQGRFDESLEQLDVARGMKTTPYDRCHIEWVASSVYSHVGTPKAKEVFQHAIDVCHGVDAEKEAVARMYLRGMKDGKPRPLLPM